MSSRTESLDDVDQISGPQPSLELAWLASLVTMLLLGFGSLSAAFAWTVLDSATLRWLVPLLVMVLIGLNSRKGWIAVLLLGMAQSDLLWNEPTTSSEFSLLTTGVCGLFLVLSACRVDVLGRLLDRDQRAAVLTKLVSLRDLPQRGTVSRGIRTLWGMGVRVVLAVLAAMWLLAWVPVDPSSVVDVRLTPYGERALRLGLWLTGVYGVAFALLEAWCWWRLSPSQARIYLSSSLVGWLHRDLRMIIKRRMREQWRTLSSARLRGASSINGPPRRRLP